MRVGLVWLFVGLLCISGQCWADEGVGVILLQLVEGKRPQVVPNGYFEYSLDPGARVEGTVELTNVGEHPLHLRAYSGDCNNNSNGDLVGPLWGEPSTKVGLWLSSPISEVTLEPRQRKRVSVAVQVPPRTPPGDYFGFYFFQPDSPEQPADAVGPAELGVAMKVESRIGVIFLCHVSAALDSRKLLQLAAPGEVRKVRKDGQLWLEVPISNAGALFLKPQASWILSNSQGVAIAREDARPLGHLCPGYPLNLAIPATRPQSILARGHYRLEVNLQDTRFPEVQAHEIYDLSLP
ncbi:hypothetical protein IV102_26905 [bacterium]|nr:hypothetical protein [bacterium]